MIELELLNMKVKNRITGIIYDAEQFIPNENIPHAIIFWTDLRPRDMSFGYVNTDISGKKHVMSRDWIIGSYHGGLQHQHGCHDCLPDSDFLKYYTPVEEHSQTSKKFNYYVSIKDNIGCSHVGVFELDFQLKTIKDVKMFEQEYSFDAKGFQLLSWQLLED